MRFFTRQAGAGLGGWFGEGTIYLRVVTQARAVPEIPRQLS